MCGRRNRKNGRYTPATLKKSLAQVISFKFCGIFRNIFFYRTPPVPVCEGCGEERIIENNGLLLYFIFAFYEYIEGVGRNLSDTEAVDN